MYTVVESIRFLTFFHCFFSLFFLIKMSTKMIYCWKTLKRRLKGLFRFLKIKWKSM